MIYACVIGRLTKDANETVREVTLSNGEKAMVCNFTVAVQDKYDFEKVTFFDCEAWRKTAEFLAKHGKKGKKVCVEADKISMNSWQDKVTGEARASVILHARDIEILEFEKTEAKTTTKPTVSLAEAMGN